VAKAGAAAVADLEAYGFHVGMAFQIIDDIIDFYDCQQTGKPRGGDLHQGIVTLPVLHVLENSAIGSELRGQILRREIDPPLIERIFTEMKICRTEDYCRNIAAGYIHESLQALNRLPFTPARDTLESVSRFILERVY